MSAPVTWGYEAGVWEDGVGFVYRSCHFEERRAREAALRYSRERYRPGVKVSGGTLSWSGGYRRIGSDSVTWLDALLVEGTA